MVALAVAAVPMTTASAAGSVTATFAKVQDWGTGHERRVTVTNGTSSTVNGWRIEFTLPSGTSISSSWDADITRSGDRYVAVNKSWASTLAPAPASAGATTAPARTRRR
ncbi:cellulose binding domain-containing protein [Micromonospora sp. BRA006-A]|nr:cellulose binding domain-containing protein [Micromonospora sp. BRA006-A]